jgi:hypothetical protein
VCIIDVIEQEQFDSSGVLGENAKVYTARNARSAQGERLTFRRLIR